MTATEPETTIDKRFGEPDATATDWATGRKRIEAAELFWLSTVRPDGRPHVTPLISVWLDDAAYFCTGPEERKAKNLEQNSSCILTTGCNQLKEGLDVVIEGNADRVSDDPKLRRIANAYETKYGSEWHFDVEGGAFKHGDEGVALVFEVVPKIAFGFGKAPHSQTRWCFN